MTTTHSDTVVKAKVQTKKAAASKKPAKTKSTQKPAKATKQSTSIKAADLAKELGVDPRKARKALRAADIRSPYTSAQRDQIISVLKKLTKTH